MLPTAILAKAHMPDLAQVVPAFNVESIEGTEHVQQRFSRKVEFESLDFNKRFWTTVPKEFDPVALRELFGPGFLAWVTTMTGEISFGVNDRQLWFLWRLRERSEEELKLALKNAGQLFRRIQSEMEESGIHTYPPGPWHAGLAPFPDAARRSVAGRPSWNSSRPGGRGLVGAAQVASRIESGRPGRTRRCSSPSPTDFRA